MSCINQILDFYHNHGSGKTLESEEIKVWFSNSLRELMEIEINKKKDYLKIRNCILLMLNLFSGNENADRYNTFGKNACNLDKKERKDMCNSLKSALN